MSKDTICETCTNISTVICDECYDHNEYSASIPCEFISDYIQLKPDTKKLIQDVVHCLVTSQ